MDRLVPFSTQFQVIDGMTSADVSQELTRLFRRQRMIDQFLGGSASLDEISEFLVDDKIDPLEWANQSIQNIEMIIGEKIV